MATITKWITMMMSLVILEDRVNTYNPNFVLKHLPTRNGGKWPRIFSDDNRIWTFKDYLKVRKYWHMQPLNIWIFKVLLMNSPSHIPGVPGLTGRGLDARNFLPDLQKSYTGFQRAYWFGYPKGDWVLKSSNSTSIKYSEDWVSGSIPPDLTYRQAILNCHTTQFVLIWNSLGLCAWAWKFPVNLS